MSNQVKNALKDDPEFAQEFRLFLADMLQSTGSSITSQSVDKPNDENPSETEFDKDASVVEEGHSNDQAETDVEEDMDYGPDYIDDEPLIDFDTFVKNASTMESSHSKDQAETDDGEDMDYGPDYIDDELHSDLDMLESDEEHIFVEPRVVIEKLSTESEDEDDEHDTIYEYMLAEDLLLSDLENSIVDSEQPSVLEQKEVSDTNEEEELKDSGSDDEQEDKDVVVEEKQQKTNAATNMTIASEDEPQTQQDCLEKETNPQGKNEPVIPSTSVRPDSPKATSNPTSILKRTSKEITSPIKKQKAIDFQCSTSIDNTPQHHEQCVTNKFHVIFSLFFFTPLFYRQI